MAIDGRSPKRAIELESAYYSEVDRAQIGKKTREKAEEEGEAFRPIEQVLTEFAEKRETVDQLCFPFLPSFRLTPSTQHERIPC